MHFASREHFFFIIFVSFCCFWCIFYALLVYRLPLFGTFIGFFFFYLKRRYKWSLTEKEETIDQILLNCIKVRVLWQLLFALFGVSWVLPLSVREILLGWHDFFVGKKCKKVWKVAHLWFFWIVWKERNILAFDNKEQLSVQRLKNSFVLYFLVLD